MPERWKNNDRAQIRRGPRPGDICRECTERRPGCRSGCERYAVEEITYIATRGPLEKKRQLYYDLKGLDVHRKRRAASVKAARYRRGDK